MYGYVTWLPLGGAQEGRVALSGSGSQKEGAAVPLVSPVQHPLQTINSKSTNLS